MSLLTLTQAAARVAGVAVPTSIVGSTDQTAARLLQAAQNEGRALSKHPWTVLVKEYTFSTVASTASYALPTDYEYHLSQSLWNRDEDRRMYGPSSSQDWQVLKSGFITSTIDQRFRIKVTSGSREFYIDPTPDSAETIAYEYVSTQWCESSAGTAQSAWAADTDVGRLDEYLMELGVTWRFLNMVGLPYSEEREEYERQVDMAKARDGGAPTLNMAAPRLTEEVIVPETGFGT
jgi:hypothetical protein